MESGKRRLRAKTGCLTCRSRRKKCDEKSPVCGLCSTSKRDCQWPTSADLLDRRYASHHQSRHWTKGQSPRSDVDAAERRIVRSSSPHAITFKISLPSESTAHHRLSLDLEAAISRHFIEKLYSLLLLPNCHPNFCDGWITEIQHLTVEHKSLHYSVLANGASHLHHIDDNGTMQELALTYYSNALRDLSKLLTWNGQLEKHNGLLMSVMLLYLHGCLGRGTYTDIPQHLSAAIRILTLRLFSSQHSLARPFDRLAVESVLYQIFMVTTGLWSENVGLDYDFDGRFWLQAEQLLDQSIMFPYGGNSMNSPVLGVPVSLFRLALLLKQQLQCVRGDGCDMVALEEIKSEVEEWETLLLCDRDLDGPSADDDQTPRTQKFYRDAMYLYILVISLLLEQIQSLLCSAASDTFGPPDMAPPYSWQIAKAVGILRERQYDDEWKVCFMGTWPVYTLGFFMNTEEQVQLVRNEMNDRWKLTRFSQIQRFSEDLDCVWRSRGFNVVERIDSGD